MINIGRKDLVCIGAHPPNDHPHIFLKTGNDATIRCPYCNTIFAYNKDIARHQTIPSQVIIRTGRYDEWDLEDLI